MKKSFWIAVIAALILPLGAVADHHEAARCSAKNSHRSPMSG